MAPDFEAIPAVVLAGGRDKGSLAAATGQPIRALIPYRGRSLVAPVLDALTGAVQVGRVVIVGPREIAGSIDGVDLIPEGEDLLANIRAGLRAHGGDGPALLVACDIPHLTPAAVDDFIARSLASGDDLCYPIIPRAAAESAFPGQKRTYVRLREGSFTGGNLILVRRSFFLKMEPLVADAYALRKQPLKLARRVGIGILFKLVTGRLAIGDVEAQVGAMLGGSVRAVRSDYAELGADVDKAGDLNPS